MQHIACVLLLGILVTGPVAFAANSSTGLTEQSAPVRTGKERLSDKGSDEQRANDCKVPLARRTQPRPSECHAP